MSFIFPDEIMKYQLFIKPTSLNLYNEQWCTKPITDKLLIDYILNVNSRGSQSLELELREISYEGKR